MRRGVGPRQILVIDDSEVLLARIKKALVDDGHVVTTTTQPVGNARHLANCDLVIIDYHMPGIDGLAVLQALRAAAAHLDREPLLYLYTSDRAISATYAELGFDGTFTKGDEEALARQVRAVFRLSEIRAVAASKARPRPPAGLGVGSPPSMNPRRKP